MGIALPLRYTKRYLNLGVTRKQFLFGMIIASYRDFSDRVSGLIIGKKSKPERIEDIISNHLGKITKSEILRQCPDISETTVERTLSALLKEGKIQKVGRGRSTGYIKSEVGTKQV